MNDQFQNQQPQINIKIEDLTDIECDDCQGKYFRPVAMMKRLSPLVNPSGKEQIVPMQVFRCDDCGHVNEIFIPK
jgi:hypothetical protein|tara:strand:+ start:315 stop:539 length:225 start_codon:yes stop_codon:yes gene_type:complete